MTTDTKVADLPAAWRATGKAAGATPIAATFNVCADELEAALARQEADKTAAPVGQECTCPAKDMTFGRCCKSARLPEPVAWYYGFADTGEAGPVTFSRNPGADAIEWAERYGHELHYLYAAQPAAQADDDWHLRGYAYASKQATTCAGCGEHKHTPLRIDAMGGYVCLTCIDNKLSSLLGEFGYTAAQAVDLEQFRKLDANWRRIADTHGVRQFSGNDHLLFANELRALIDQQAGKGVPDAQP